MATANRSTGTALNHPCPEPRPNPYPNLTLAPRSSQPLTPTQPHPEPDQVFQHLANSQPVTGVIPTNTGGLAQMTQHGAPLAMPSHPCSLAPPGARDQCFSPPAYASPPHDAHPAGRRHAPAPLRDAPDGTDPELCLNVQPSIPTLAKREPKRSCASRRTAGSHSCCSSSRRWRRARPIFNTCACMEFVMCLCTFSI